MVKTRKDLTNMRFGKLTVVSQTEDYISPNGRHVAQWNCNCDCKNPNMVKATGNNLLKGNTTSCGCYHYYVITKKDRGRKCNNYDLTGEYGIGWSTNTNREFYFDLEDYDKIKNYAWFQNKQGYLQTNNYNDKAIKIHQLIKHSFVDHHNRNKLDNRKENLWDCLITENAQNSIIAINNTSGIVGVNWHKYNKKWNVRICKDKKRISLGYFDIFEDAVKARLQAEKKYYKDFAPQRHLFEQYNIV